MKDIKPGLKNLNLIFIVLETGGYAGAQGQMRGFSGSVRGSGEREHYL